MSVENYSLGAITFGPLEPERLRRRRREGRRFFQHCCVPPSPKTSGRVTFAEPEASLNQPEVRLTHTLETKGYND